MDPILLDLTGNGIGTTSYKNDAVLFDMDHSGTLKRTSWADEQTGILVKPDANGNVTNISQLFSEYYGGTAGTGGNAGNMPFVNGFAALASEDSNHDGQITSSDASWSQLKVWVDSNHDATVNAGELRTLSSLGITQFSTGNYLDQGAINGNPITATSTFMMNGISRTMSDLNLIAEESSHTFTTQGTGTLDTTVTKDSDGVVTTVKTYQENSSANSTLDASTLNVDNVDGGVGNDTLIAKSTGSWLIGGGGSNTYQGGIGNDVFVISSSDGPANVHGGGGEDMVMVGSSTGMTINMAQMDVTIAEGGTGNDVIMSGGRSAVYIQGGSGGNDLLIGGAGDDVITGGGGHNTIIGGTGKAIIYAGPNGDLIYGAKGDSIINAGKGNDTIVGGMGNDVIKVGMGNANIDGGGGTNIVQFHGSYGDYNINKVANGYWISDKVTNRDGTVYVTNVQELNFSDIQAINLSSVYAMPVKDTITTNSTGGLLNRTQTHLISASQLLANDQALSSTGPLRISAVSNPVGGTVQLTQAGDVQFTPDSTYTGIMSFRYTVMDAQGHSAMTVTDASTNQNAVMNAKVTLATPDVPTDPLVSQEWYLSDANVLPVWQDYTGKGIRIGQFEPGGPYSVEPEVLNYNHPDLEPNIDLSWYTTQFLNGTLPNGSSNHATMVAGIMVAARNGSGAIGVAYDAKIAGEYNDGYASSLGNLVQYDVANNSWSIAPNFGVSNLDPNTSQSDGDLMLATAKYAAMNGRGGKGTVIVEGAGNGRQNQESAQGSLINNSRYSIQVGGVNAPGDLSTLNPVGTPFSNAGASILVSAPASNIASTSQLVITSQGSIYGSDSSVMDGTSFATPIVSGIVALMLEANPNLGYRDVQEILAISARKINDSNTTWTTNTGTHWNGGGMHTSQDYGFGNVDALAAVRLAETWMGQKTGTNESVVSATNNTVKNVTAGNTVSSTVTMASGIQVEHAEVDVDLSYSHLKDVTLKLISPNGTQSILLSNNEPNNTSTALKYTFMSTHDWGEKSAGIWTLQVTDSATGSPIALNNWSLRLYGSQTTANDTYFYTNEYAAQVAQNSARATLNDAVNGTSGGINTINAAAMSGNTSINLLTGAASLNQIVNSSGTVVTPAKALTIQNPTNFNNIFTGDGNDTLVANNNKGILDGGRGTNTLTGGTGKNIFVVHQRANGLDTINNFSVSQGDRLDLVGFGSLNYSQVTRTQQGSDVLLGGLGNGQSILVKNITVSALTSGQFAFQDTFVAPDGFINSASSNDNIVTGVGTVMLQGGFNNAATTDTSNGQLSYALSGTVYRHDLATADNFVIVNPGSGPFNNALQGFKPGIDKIDLSQVGIPDASYIYLKPRDYVIFNTTPVVHGVEVNFWNGTQDVPMVYLDSIEAAQLKASDFIFANGLPGPDAFVPTTEQVTPNHRVPLDTDGTEDPFVVGTSNGITISTDGSTVTSSVDFVLPNTINKLVFTGTDTLVGTGNNNGDIFTSNNGADTFIGGAGNDTYIVNNSDVYIVENPNGGTDNVQASVSYALNDNVENLTLTGSNDINGTGNAQNNVITGNTGSNILDGGAGADNMSGGTGNDIYIVDNIGDVVTENAGEGIDTVQSSITYTLGNNVENLLLTGSANINGSGNDIDNQLTGNDGNNSLTGATGNDTLDGGAGIDTLKGGLGNDLYVVDSTTDTIIENMGEGTDTVQSSVSYTLGANLENLTLTGTDAITGTGNNLDNVLIGNSANNTLNGGAGSDVLIGGAGDDLYIIDSALDVITEKPGEGIDTVQSSVTYTLASDVENLTLTGSAAIQGTGNALANVITGNSGSNTLIGGGGNDTFDGGAGNDTYAFSGTWGADLINADSSGTDTVDFTGTTAALTINLTSSSNYEASDGTNTVTWFSDVIDNAIGGSGNDTLIGSSGANLLTGGAGNDSLAGGAGNDTFVFGNGWGNDTVSDSSGSDTLDFSAVTSNLYITYTNATSSTNSVAFTSVETVRGGAGIDTFDLSMVGAIALNVNFNTGTILAGGGTFGFSSIETFKTSSANDSIIGNNLANTIIANAGNDTLTGGGGNDTLNGGTGNDVYSFSKGDGSDRIIDADPTSGNLDKIVLDNTITQANVALFKTSNNDLQIGYTDSTGDLITIQSQFVANNSVERVELANGKFMTDADINAVIASMSSYAASNGISLTSIGVVEGNAGLMNLVNSGWHS